MDRRSQFEEKGFYIEPNLYSQKDMEEMFFLFYDVFLSLAEKFDVPLRKEYKKTSDISYAEHLKELDHLILDCFNHDKNIIGEGYDIVSYSLVFLRFLSNKKIEEITQEILGLDRFNTLYGWTNRVRIDPPADERRTVGWHQEIFYTVPESRFLQTWAPVIRDTTLHNGTIWIQPGSHKEGVAKQSWTEIDGRATQIIVDESVTSKYEEVQLAMKVGDVLFFDGRLSHRSGSNYTEDEIRLSLVGMWHDVHNRNFRGPKPNFSQRTTIDRKDYWNRCNKELNWGY